jgi:hypothetical protein
VALSRKGISPGVKRLLGFDPDADDKVVRKEWQRRTKHVCKPCWELRYCPYGPLVEDFPLSPVTKAKTIEELSEKDLDVSCMVFGHVCPVFFINEPFTETPKMRPMGRRISFKVRMRVARRDNYTCQVCGKHLKDEELEYDHIFPFSKGGSSVEHNIRLVCRSCNRQKGNRAHV